MSPRGTLTQSHFVIAQNFSLLQKKRRFHFLASLIVLHLSFHLANADEYGGGPERQSSSYPRPGEPQVSSEACAVGLGQPDSSFSKNVAKNSDSRNLDV
jgi:hypothetical protein